MTFCKNAAAALQADEDTSMIYVKCIRIEINIYYCRNNEFPLLLVRERIGHWTWLDDGDDGICPLRSLIYESLPPHPVRHLCSFERPGKGGGGSPLRTISGMPFQVLSDTESCYEMHR